MNAVAEIYVLDLPEFSPVVEGARAAGCEIITPKKGYWTIKGNPDIHLRRKELGLTAALWNTALAGGIHGRLQQFDATELKLSGK